MSSPPRQRKQPSSAILAKEPQASIDPAPSTTIRDTNTSRKLLTYDKIPTWLQDNEYIQSGYRPETNSTALCFASWSYIHNETVNIYTHLLPAIAALISEIILFRFFEIQYPASTTGDKLAFAIFLLAAAICLGMSTIYHTLMNHSERISNLWLRLDYVGIVILTLGDFVSGIYLIFYCEPMLQKVYWTMIATLSLATAIILINPRLQGPRFRTLRVCTFVLTGLSGLAPLIHGLKRFGLAHMNTQTGMPYYLLEGLLLILGAGFYATRLPECVRPGRFDIWGCSHQVFHVLVVVATGVHAVGVLRAFEYRYWERGCGG